MSSGTKKVLLGELLVAAKMVSTSDVEKALVLQKKSGLRIGSQLVAMGVVSELQVTQTLSKQLGVPWVSLYHVDFSRELLNLLPPELVDRHTMIPVYIRQAREGRTLFIAMEDPANDEALDTASEVSGLRTKAMIAPASDIRNAIRVYYLGGRPASYPPMLRDALAAKPPSKPPTRKSSKPPARRKSDKPEKEKAEHVSEAPKNKEARPTPEETLTAKDLIAALLARSQGTDVSDVLREVKWEPLFAALLSVLLKKGLIADWEFIDEWYRNNRE